MALKKRFYRTATVTPELAAWRVQLDDRNLRSPAGAALALPGRELADAVAREWQAQEDEIDPATMPLFSLAVTVVDRVTPQRDTVIAELAAYGGNDLLCYRDDTAELAQRQHTDWQPWLDWVQKTHDIGLIPVSGIMPVDQREAGKFSAVIALFDDWRLGILHRATSLSGSLVLGLGFVDGALDSEQLFQLAFLDELWQNEKWGTDFEAAERQQAIRAEFDHAARFLGLLPAAGRR